MNKLNNFVALLGMTLTLVNCDSPTPKSVEEVETSFKEKIKSKISCVTSADCTAQKTGCHTWIPYSKNQSIADELKTYEKELAAANADNGSKVVCTEVCTIDAMDCLSSQCTVSALPKDGIDILETLKSGCDELRILK